MKYGHERLYRVNRGGGLWAFFLGHPSAPSGSGRRAPRCVCTAQEGRGGLLVPEWWNEDLLTTKPRGGVRVLSFGLRLRQQLGLLAADHFAVSSRQYRDRAGEERKRRDRARAARARSKMSAEELEQKAEVDRLKRRARLAAMSAQEREAWQEQERAKRRARYEAQKARGKGGEQ